MAEKERAESSPDLNVDDRYEKSCPPEAGDPDSRPDVRGLLGYYSEWDRDRTYVRLYFSPELNRYWKILEESIWCTQGIRHRDGPRLNGIVLWVYREASVESVELSPGAAQGEFLEGRKAPETLEGAEVSELLPPRDWMYGALQTPRCCGSARTCIEEQLGGMDLQQLKMPEEKIAGEQTPRCR